jgi:FemAB-related protein (PEP-CTERM system-associated)
MKTIDEVFGYRPMHVIALRGDRIVGVLPLFFVKNILIKRALISTPFAVYGGTLADSQEAREAIRDHVAGLAESLGVQYVELRNAHEAQCADMARLSRYVTFTQSIGGDDEALLGAIPRKTRYMVRKALKEPFETRRTTEDIQVFEDLYSRSLQRLGTPCFPKSHFRRLLANFRGAIDIREVWMNGEAAAAVLSFYFRDQVLPYYGASDPQFNAAAPNNFMYYDLMRWGGAHGYRVFDFGRSKKEGSGSCAFKAHWGMTERELPYEVLLVKRTRMPDYSPNNRAFQLPQEIWRRLPLGVTRALGPHFLRLVP